MTMAFFPFAALAVIGGGLAVLSRDARRQRFGFMAAFVGLAALMVMLQAGIVGVIVLACGALIAGVTGSAGPAQADAQRPNRLNQVVLAGGLGVIGFVLLSTLSRQYVSYGADLADDPGFGGYARLASEMFGRHALAIEIVALVLVAALVTVGLAFREAQAPPPTDEGAK
jgi:NADH:ubiquinone oxidoreductase subunit 6 (subunit J)